MTTTLHGACVCVGGFRYSLSFVSYNIVKKLLIIIIYYCLAKLGPRPPQAYPLSYTNGLLNIAI